eukprot:jgi/Psemu1/264271/estExt_Genewise1Plus.C_15390008
MLLNYHEMTMTENKDSPQRRLQFQVICGIMATCFVYSVYISGILLTIEPYETNFPGGIFCYKQLQRDYVASMGTGRRLQTEILEGFPEEDEAEGVSVKERKEIIEDKVYHVYLDNPEDVGGAHMRWMTGVIVRSRIEEMSYCDPLFEKNSAIQREKELNKDTPDTEKKGSELFNEAIYESLILPEVDSLAIKFPFSNGFTSGLVLSYKIIPEMRALAAEKGVPGNAPVVISQCSVGKAECTHYVPLSRSSQFHGGRLPTEEYQKEIVSDSFNLFGTLKGGLRVVFPFLKPYIGATPTNSAASESENSEL